MQKSQGAFLSLPCLGLSAPIRPGGPQPSSTPGCQREANGPARRREGKRDQKNSGRGALIHVHMGYRQITACLGE